MKKNAFLIAGVLLCAISCHSQSNLDSVIGKYLVERKQLEKPIDSIHKTGNKLLKNTNYFLEKKPIIRLSRASSIHPVIFGCYKSHTNKYLLIHLKTNLKSVFYFYGENNLFDEIDKLKKQILEDLKLSLNDEALATLINYLSFCYL